MKIRIDKLQPHPLNHRIYGYDDNSDLMEKIRQSGYVKPILITPNYTIISGHRRVDCCKKLGIEEIEYEIVEGDYTRLLEIMISENQYRVKTNTQLLKESEIYYEIEKKKSYQRQIETGKQNLGQSPDESKLTYLGETGRTTEIVSKKIGMSESTYKKGRKIMERLKEEHDPRILWIFENTTNHSVDSGYKLTEKPIGFVQEVIDRTGGDKYKIPSVIREVEQEMMTQKSNLPPGKYGIILFDLTNRHTLNLLQTTISPICEDDSILFIWVKTSQLESGIELGKHWGFRYGNCLVWNRDVMNEVSEYVELLLVFVKGSPKTIFKTHEGSTEKPPSVKEIIEIGYPGWSRVEIFVGEEIDGWEIW